ncbi:tannase/feruloyl esterase family alpha/beta hydrolase [Methylosarcina fibrata]|uniref:tannase/feruloyl esterase family alpha/beta hydrolase n=1 Tax=Methylosarcina fibrata TaxID=105972 RepID=UPI00037013A2|nr:tannase/feruloyl esterase family alpha/beta hydrolase [Methylosarcina fibrata]
MRFAQIPSENSDLFGKKVRYCAGTVSLLALLVFTTVSQAGPSPILECSMAGVGSVGLVTDDSSSLAATIESAAPETTNTGIPYCLVKVLVPEAIHIWIGLPTGGNWNGRLQSEGGSVYAGINTIPASTASGYVGITTDTGHTSIYSDPSVAPLDGSFAMSSPGNPNIPLQMDFAYRSIHLMAVIGKQLTQAFYGTPPGYSYFNGCSTGGRQGLAMAQRYPEDYDGILAGAPAIHFDRFQAAMIWPQMASRLENGGAVTPDKLTLATNAAVAACDDLDGVVDGVLTDPRDCTYGAEELASAGCTASDNTCLTASEAAAINKIWYGSTNEKKNKRLWYGEVRGTDLSALAGPDPFQVAIEQPRYWVYFDPSWDWQVLDYSNFKAFFDKTIDQMKEGGTATDNPDLAVFRDHGGKLILWHGFADQLIMPEGTIDYYDKVVNKLGGDYPHAQEFARLFMAPGVAHCGYGINTGPLPQNPFDYVVNWVENGVAPETILASKAITSGTQTRPLCPYPNVAVYSGQGSTDNAANFECKPGKNNAVLIQSPNGGEVWNEKSRQTITWISRHLDDKLSLALYLSIDNGQTWTKIASPKNTVAKAWKVPKNRYVSKQALFKVCVKPDESLCDVSDAVFTINQAPKAEAGKKQKVTVGAEVRLDGSASVDADTGPSPLTYRWTQISGPAIILNGADTATPNFTPTAKGSYKFSLTVNDGAIDSKTDKVTVHVLNAP